MNRAASRKQIPISKHIKKHTMKTLTPEIWRGYHTAWSGLLYESDCTEEGQAELGKAAQRAVIDDELAKRLSAKDHTWDGRIKLLKAADATVFARVFSEPCKTAGGPQALLLCTGTFCLGVIPGSEDAMDVLYRE